MTNGTEGLSLPRKKIDIPKTPFPKGVELSSYPKDADKATFLRRGADILGVEPGIGGEPVDYIICMEGSDAIGLGPYSQLAGLQSVAYEIGQVIGAEVGYVGPVIDVPDVFDMIGPTESSNVLQEFRLPEGLLNENIPAKYRATAKVLTEVLTKLSEEGKRRILILVDGYQGYVPFGVKKALEKINNPELQIRVVLKDSCHPDPLITEELFTDDGMPTHRFANSAYGSTKQMATFLLKANMIPFNSKFDKDNAPWRTFCTATPLPFPTETINKFGAFRRISKADARDQLRQDHEAVLIGFFANNDYFSLETSNRWLTGEQQKDMIIGARTIIDSLSKLAGQINKTIITLGPEEFIKIAHRESLPANLKFVQTPRLKQSGLAMLYRAIDLAIVRTVQMNTTFELALCGAPFIVVSMPEHGFMNSGRFDKTYKDQGLRSYNCNVSSEELMDKIREVVTNAKEAFSLVSSTDNIIMPYLKDTHTSFTNIIGHIAGIPLTA